MTIRVEALLPEALDVAPRSAYPPYGACDVSPPSASGSVTPRRSETATRRVHTASASQTRSSSHPDHRRRTATARTMTTSTRGAARPPPSVYETNGSLLVTDDVRHSNATTALAATSPATTTFLRSLTPRSNSRTFGRLDGVDTSTRQTASAMTSSVVAASMRATATGLALVSAVVGKSGLMSVSQASRQRSVERLSTCGAAQDDDATSTAASFLEFPIQLPLSHGGAVANAIVSSCGAVALAGWANLVLYGQALLMLGQPVVLLGWNVARRSRTSTSDSTRNVEINPEKIKIATPLLLMLESNTGTTEGGVSASPALSNPLLKPPSTAAL